MLADRFDFTAAGVGSRESRGLTLATGVYDCITCKDATVTVVCANLCQVRPLRIFGVGKSLYIVGRGGFAAICGVLQRRKKAEKHEQM